MRLVSIIYPLPPRGEHTGVRCAALSISTALIAAHANLAAAAGAFAAPAHQNLPGPAGGALRVTVALIVVLAAVFAAAWLTRRVHGGGTTRSGALQVLGQLPLGPRERAVLIRVGAERVLLGVASGSVRMLHVLPPGEAEDSAGGTPLLPSAETPTRPTFKSMLLKSLGK